MALSTIEKLKIHLFGSSAAHAEDTLLAQLLAEVDAAVKSHVGWNPEQATYTEYYDGPPTNELPLKNTPVITTGLRVWLDEGGLYGQASGAFAAETELTIGTHFYLKLDGPGAAYSLSGLLVRVDGPWSRRYARHAGRLAAFPAAGRGAVKVTYTGGYATVPRDIELAVHQLAALVRAGRAYGQAVASEGYEGYSVSFRQAAAESMASAEHLLHKYRRLAI